MCIFRFELQIPMQIYGDDLHVARDLEINKFSLSLFEQVVFKKVIFSDSLLDSYFSVMCFPGQHDMYLCFVRTCNLTNFPMT